MKMNNWAWLAIALPFLLSSCVGSPDDQFKREVRSAINNGFDDPQLNKEAQEAFRKHLGWDGAITFAKQYCKWIEEGKSEQEITQILTDKIDTQTQDPKENIRLMFVYFAIEDPAIRAYCPGRNI